MVKPVPRTQTHTLHSATRSGTPVYTYTRTVFALRASAAPHEPADLREHVREHLRGHVLADRRGQLDALRRGLRRVDRPAVARDGDGETETEVADSAVPVPYQGGKRVSVSMSTNEYRGWRGEGEGGGGLRRFCEGDAVEAGYGAVYDADYLGLV